MKKLVVFVLSVFAVFTLAGCNNKSESEIEKIIASAETMTREELFAKAYEESNGKELFGIGNSSRGATAGTTFVAAIKAIYPDYTGKINWQQPKENSIFTMLTSDSNGANPIFSMTLIQDGNQIQSKMLDTKILHNFVPKEWRAANGVNLKNDGNPLALQTLNKVFMYNTDRPTAINNVWQFVAKNEKPLFMGLESEPVGFNFLLMLTQEKYADMLKDAFDALSATEKAYFQPTVDSLVAKAKEYKLSANGKYSLAWIKLWVNQMNVQTDDGPIMNSLVSSSAVGQSGLLVYSKLRSISETETNSINNVKVAAYETGYKGFGGYGYKHYLLIPKTSPLPWTALAFISYMVTTEEGFHPWGKDMGGYSANPTIRLDHSKDGFVDNVNTFPVKNDRGFDWWANAGTDGGRLVLEDPVYASKVSFTVGEWISNLKS